MGEKVGSGETAFQVFVTLRGSPDELELKARNYWIYSDSRDLQGRVERFMEQSLEESARTSNVPVPIVFVSFPCAKDPTWSTRFPGKANCIVAGPSNYRWFKEWENRKVKKRGEEYESLKNALADRFMELFYAVFPQLSDKVEFYEGGSPITHSHYIAATEGAICGLNHSPFRFSAEAAAGLRPKTDIPGLYITGQDICVCGYTGALFGGLACASAVLNRNLMADLMEVKKERVEAKKKSLNSVIKMGPFNFSPFQIVLEQWGLSQL